MFLIVVLIALASCSKSHDQPSPKPIITDSVADITNFRIVGMNPDISLTPYYINMRFADSVYYISCLTVSFTLSPIVALEGNKEIALKLPKNPQH